jgi:hypothetical protein
MSGRPHVRDKGCAAVEPKTTDFTGRYSEGEKERVVMQEGDGEERGRMEMGRREMGWSWRSRAV